jgi:hypothetical protein
MKIFLKKTKEIEPGDCDGCYLIGKQKCDEYIDLCIRKKIIFKKMTDEEVNEYLYKLYLKANKLRKILENEDKNAK